MGKIRDLASILGKTQALNPEKSALLDSADLPVTAVSSGILALSSLDSLPAASLSPGDTAYISSSNRFYVSNGSGWYNVALVNVTPSLTISPDGAIALSTDGTPTTITLTGQDSDNTNLTFSVESDGSFLGLGTIAQDSSVFTITPFSSDSATQSSSTLTFKVTDGIGIGSGTTALSLSFSVANSSFTTFLAKADTAGNDNQVDASTGTHSITEAGDVTSTPFAPYHPGGYSVSFDGTGDNLVFDLGTTIGTADFTIEGWIRADENAHRGIFQISSDTNGITTSFQPTLGLLFRKDLDGTNYGWQWYGQNSATANTSGGGGGGANLTDIVVGKWYHFAYVKTSGNGKVYINGEEVLTRSDSTDYSALRYVSIGAVYDSNYYWKGQIRDFRVVIGTAIYTSEFTGSLPTQALTAVTNTKLLTCHLPYIADGSTTGATPTINGDTKTVRMSPYSTLGYSKSSHGGSVKLDGTGDYLSVAYSADHTFGSGQFNVECWVFMTAYEGTGFNTFLMKSDGTNNDWQLDYKNGTTQIRFIPYVSNSAETSAAVATATLNLNQWHHIAVSRDGSNNLRLFHNGSLLKTTSYSSTIDADGNATLEIGARQNGGTRDRLLNGYMSDLRIVKGSAVYTAAFTPPTNPLTAITNTKLLTCTNKQSIFDATARPPEADAGRMTTVGTVVASNTQRKFDTSSSITFASDDANADYITKTLLTAVGTRDFTVEAWIWLNSGYSGGRGICQISATSGGLTSTLPGSIGIGVQSGNYRMYASGGYPVLGYVNSSTSALVDQWAHLALSKTGGNSKLYLNGTEIATIADTYDYTGTYLAFGCWYATNYSWDGYIQDFRITYGLGRYTSNFTPSTSTFSA